MVSRRTRRGRGQPQQLVDLVEIKPRGPAPAQSHARERADSRRLELSHRVGVSLHIKSLKSCSTHNHHTSAWCGPLPHPGIQYTTTRSACTATAFLPVPSLVRQHTCRHQKVRLGANQVAITQGDAPEGCQNLDQTR